MLEKILESTLDYKEIHPVHPKGNHSWIFVERTDVEAETPILLAPDVKNLLFGKDPDAGKDWRQKEKGTTEDEMVRWHHHLDGHEFESALGVGDGQGSLACCSPWGLKNRTWLSDWTELNWYLDKFLQESCWWPDFIVRASPREKAREMSTRPSGSQGEFLLAAGWALISETECNIGGWLCQGRLRDILLCQLSVHWALAGITRVDACALTKSCFFAVIIQLLSRVCLCTHSWTAARQASLALTSHGVYPSSCPLNQWCYSTISSGGQRMRWELLLHSLSSMGLLNTSSVGFQS